MISYWRAALRRPIGPRRSDARRKIGYQGEQSGLSESRSMRVRTLNGGECREPCRRFDSEPNRLRGTSDTVGRARSRRNEHVHCRMARQCRCPAKKNCPSIKPPSWPCHPLIWEAHAGSADRAHHRRGAAARASGRGAARADRETARCRSSWPRGRLAAAPDRCRTTGPTRAD